MIEKRGAMGYLDRMSIRNLLASVSFVFFLQQKEREQRRKRGESDPVAQRQITLKDIIDKQRTLGVDK